METTIVHGDIFKIQTEAEKQAELAKHPRLRTKAEKLIEDCPTCALEQQRVDNAHALGFQSELQDVELPDGTRVPAKLLVERYLESQRQEKANAVKAKAINAANKGTDKKSDS